MQWGPAVTQLVPRLLPSVYFLEAALLTALRYPTQPNGAHLLKRATLLSTLVFFLQSYEPTATQRPNGPPDTISRLASAHRARASVPFPADLLDPSSDRAIRAQLGFPTVV